MDANNTNTMHERLDVFDDEFAVDDFDGLADGFAPGRVLDDANSDDSDGDDPPIRSVAPHMSTSPPQSLPRFGGNRNSIRKSPEMQNPFRSREDDGDDNGVENRVENQQEDEDEDGESVFGRAHSIRSQSTVAYAPGIYHRSLSSTSSRPYAPSQSPFQASSGPSHPYAMYPQGTNLGRTASISTISTVRAPQRSSLVQDRGPTHPYAIYPQNVTEDIDESDSDHHSASRLQTAIPVGFPGHTQAFHRQQGPEGEEHDIIGEDGHAEQLPPYSEYPENGVPRHIVLPTVPSTLVAPSSGTQIALPLMQGQLQSMSDGVTQPSARSLSSMEQMESMPSNLESNQSTTSTIKRWADKSWKEKRKTKFCGIPFWWLLLSLGVLAFIAVVLGAAIGGFMSTQKHGSPKHSPVPSSSRFFDVSPITTSSAGSPPPTGTYALSLGSAVATQSACLTNSTYSAAWSCNITESRYLAIGIQNQSNTGNEGAYLFDTSNNGYKNFSYGTQIPSTSFSQFVAVSDNTDLERGPAYYFEAYYDKLVIVPESAFPSVSTSQRKRDASNYSLNSAWNTRDQIAAGEKPWFCFWNGTMLEGFVYTNNFTSTSSSVAVAAFVTSPPAQSPTSSSTTYFTTTISGSSTTATLTAASATSASPSVSYAGTNAERSGMFNGNGNSNSNSGPAFPPPPPPSGSPSPPFSNSNAERAVNENTGTLSEFNYVLKIEERRVQNSVSPYCVMMQILNDGTAGVVKDSSGNPMQIDLGETDPSDSAYQSAISSSSSSSSSNTKRSNTVAGGCYCEWWSGA